MDASAARKIAFYRVQNLPRDVLTAMRSFSLIQFKKRSLSLVWLTLGIYVWLSSVVQLDHTEDLRAVLIQSAISTALAVPVHTGATESGVRTTLSHGARPAPSEPCAACEWITSVHTASAPSVAVLQLPVGYDIVQAEQFTTALLQRDNRLVTLRGPPAVV